MIDVGGNHVKLSATGMQEPLKFDSGPKTTPKSVVGMAQKAIAGQKYAGISLGYPGLVLQGKIAAEPHNLGAGWVGFDFDKAFGCPVKIVNDAAMQALGSYTGGRMLFLGLGTGLGSALVLDGVLAPMELAHLPYRKGQTYEDYVGFRGYERLGKKRWRRHVQLVVEQLKYALEADYVVLGGGNVKFLKELPKDTRLGDNANAFLGGYRLWENSPGSASERKGSNKE